MPDGGSAPKNPFRLVQTVEDDDTFHLGQVYEEKAAATVACSICGGREFNVGQGNYFTAIRCVKCGWELCFHDG